MRRVSHMVIVWLFLVVSPTSIAAQDASPETTPTAIECVAPPLPPGTPTPLEELMPEPIPPDDMAGMAMGTPDAEPAGADASPEGAATSSGPLPGQLADEETTARITATVENVVACLNSGDGLAFAALITAGYMEDSFGITNPYDMVYFLEGLPPLTLMSVDNVLTHDDGRYSAEVLQRGAGGQVDRFQALFVEDGDLLLLDEEISLPVEGADATVDVTMLDFSFETSETALPTGKTVAFNVVNKGEYPHEFLIVQFLEGTTVEGVLEDPSLQQNILVFGGVYADPGESAYFALENMPPGTYTVVCFVDVPDGIPHVMPGMIAELTVE